jgi:hypothetical protein
MKSHIQYIGHQSINLQIKLKVMLLRGMEKRLRIGNVKRRQEKGRIVVEGKNWSRSWEVECKEGLRETG